MATVDEELYYLGPCLVVIMNDGPNIVYRTSDGLHAVALYADVGELGVNPAEQQRALEALGVETMEALFAELGQHAKPTIDPDSDEDEVVENKPKPTMWEQLKHG